MSFLKFPDGFLWGGALSAIQVESTEINRKSLTNWDVFYNRSKDLFFDKIGPGSTCDHYKKYDEDFKLFSQVGSNSFRTSILWSRICPEENVIDYDEINHYHRYIDEAIKNNLKVFICLSHFDLPEWAYKKGGFENFEVIEKFLEFSKIVLNEYGSKIDAIFTFNEPLVPIIHGYLFNAHPPGVNNPKRAFQAGFGIILAHAKVANYFYNEYQNKNNLKLGVILNLTPAIACDGVNHSQADLKAAHMSNLLLNDSMMNPMVLGKIDAELVNLAKERNILPTYRHEDLTLIKKAKVDILGVNYYHPNRVQKPDLNANGFLESFFKPYDWDKARINVFRGWEIEPKSLYDLGILIRDKYNNIPWFVSENGMGVENEDIFRNKETEMIEDDYRIAFLSEHLAWLHQAIEEGCSCFGYHLWSLIDNWSFRNAFKNRYGLIELDYDTKERKIKKSGLWFKQLSKVNGLDSEFKKIEETIDLKKIKYNKSV